MTPRANRPNAADDRVEARHWEGNLITGTMNQLAIGTIVERTTRFTMLVYFTGAHDAERLCDSMIQLFGELQAGLRRSLTWDQGIEMARHHEFAVATDMEVFFCEPRTP